MKLNTITFNNFRIFENNSFQFKPLTILTGPNSSGKSTVVKSLILLQENLETSNLGRLTFKDGSHKLGNFQSILTRNSKKNAVTFDLKYENTKYKDAKNYHLLNGIEYINLIRTYEQDIHQSQNGILTYYEIKIDNEITLIKCYKGDKSFQIDINHDWFITKILKNNLFRFKPDLYKIWDKLKVKEVNQALKNWHKRLHEEEQEEIENINYDEIEEYSNLKTRLSEITTQLNELDNNDYSKDYLNIIKQIRKVEREEDKKKQQIKKEINQIEKELESLEKESKNYDKLEEEQQVLEIQLEQIENEKDDKTRTWYSERENIELKYNTSEDEQKLYIDKENIEHQVKKIEDKQKITLEEKYQELREKVREGSIRTDLYNQLKEASQLFLSNLKNTKLTKDVPDLGKKTIADYLVNQDWGNKIYDITEKKEGENIADLIKWSKETQFIQKITLEDQRTEKEKDANKGAFTGIKFYEIIGKGNKNQLAQLLIEQVSELIYLFNEKLSFVALSAMRGFQQRIYQTSKTNHHLEDALSVLLNMQYKDNKEQLQFINHWIYQFGITEKSKDKLIVEAIEGDYVRGFIEQQVGEKTKRINIADLGLGIAQLIPIIIYTADAIDSHKLICIEEPGTHLHPNLQSKLVEFIQDGIDKKINFLLETHSEYFIRKLQYQVVHDDKFTSENLIIRYFASSKEEDLKVSIREDGELLNFETNEVITSLGDGFLDEATKWVNLQKAIKLVKEGNKVIACEGENEVVFNSLNLPNCIFYGKNGKEKLNSKAVYITIQREPVFWGLRDGDFLTKSEKENICRQYSNYKILDYYSYESYLYHPDNLEELCQLNGLEFSKEDYVNEIKRQIKNKFDLINRGIREARKTYEELKNDQELAKEKKSKKTKCRNERENFIASSLKSEDFEIAYTYFDMKKEFDRTCLGHYQFSEVDFYSTNWFKQQIANILGIELSTTTQNNQY